MTSAYLLRRLRSLDEIRQQQAEAEARLARAAGRCPGGGECNGTGWVYARPAPSGERRACGECEDLS